MPIKSINAVRRDMGLEEKTRGGRSKSNYVHIVLSFKLAENEVRRLLQATVDAGMSESLWARKIILERLDSLDKPSIEV